MAISGLVSVALSSPEGHRFIPPSKLHLQKTGKDRDTACNSQEPLTATQAMIPLAQQSPLRKAGVGRGAIVGNAYVPSSTLGVTSVVLLSFSFGVMQLLPTATPQGCNDTGSSPQKSGPLTGTLNYPEPMPSRSLVDSRDTPPPLDVLDSVSNLTVTHSLTVVTTTGDVRPTHTGRTTGKA